MASSSTSSIDKSFKYDVFLSFRGEDTRTNFIDHLYYALQKKNIHTYKDNERIKKGKRISDELIHSIEDSKFYIIVFSKNYVSSSWCLDELVKIMECRKTAQRTVYPVFYDVEPSDIRKQSRAVSEAFAKFEKKEATGKWREALKEVADIAGWELKNTTDGHEAKFIEKIVEEISVELRSISFNFDGMLVGMETRVKDVVSFLATGKDDVRMIGIKGMGGGGKTTLARVLFDKISFQFEGKSFVENVGDVSKASLSGLKSLQNQVLSDVLNDDGNSVSGIYDGKNMMKRMMHGIKVLVVLDDVDHVDQLEALAGEPNWFKPGSRIIVTTRDEQVLIAHRVKLIHNVNLLSDKEAICLFSRYAFGREIPYQGYEELSGRVVRYAAGLPLTIRVLGSFLCGKNELEWIDALERLKKIPLAGTLAKLELSYIGLEEDYKDIFLDVACLLEGWPKEAAIEALESCGFHARNALKVLEQKSLITIDDDGCVAMHDHIKELGRNIVRRLHPNQPNKHSRLWIKDEIENILANDLVRGTETTRCIGYYNHKVNPEIVMKGLRMMKELRFLYIEFSDARKSDCYVGPYFPNALQYLHWNQYPFRSLPKTFQADNLVTLRMTHSRIVQLWEGGERKVLDKLRFLDLSDSMLTTIDLELTPNLEMLTLGGCGCVVELSNSISMLKHLKSLILDDCRLLEMLPGDLGRLESLVELSLSSTKIEHLPDSICMLKHLKSLKLGGCLLLAELPKDLGRLECLEELILSSTKIKHLPDSICMLKHLISLELVGCSLLEKLPADLGRLECLRELSLSSTNIKHLPDSICMLKHLKHLKLSYCPLLEELHEDLGQLECLEMLDLFSAKIKHLPDSICLLKHLKYLELTNCLLEKLPDDVGRLECLERLSLSYTNIKHLPDSICMLKNLHFLELDECSLLEKLPEDLGRLECLKRLCLSYTKIKHLPDSICMLKHLESLVLNHCSLLGKLPKGFGRLECLEELDIKGTSISRLPRGILWLKGLRIVGSISLFQLCGFTSGIQISEDGMVCYVKI